MLSTLQCIRSNEIKLFCRWIASKIIFIIQTLSTVLSLGWGDGSADKVLSMQED